MKGFAQQAGSMDDPSIGQSVMNEFDPDQVAVYKALVSEFAVFDQWFAVAGSFTVALRHNELQISKPPRSSVQRRKRRRGEQQPPNLTHRQLNLHHRPHQIRILTLPFQASSNISRLSASLDGVFLLAIDNNSRCLFINLRRRAVLHRISFKKPIAAAKFSPDGSFIAVVAGKLVDQIWRSLGFKKELSWLGLSPIVMIR